MRVATFQQNQGIGSAAVYISSGSILLAALIGFVVAGTWALSRG
jgi:hypothetical protein